MNWFKITEARNIPLREGRCVSMGRRELAVFHLPDRFLAIDNRCPHQQGPLCDGITKGTSVVCPLHGWTLSLESGDVLKPDVQAKVATYPARVVNGVVEVQLPEPKDRNGSSEAAA